MKKNVIFTGAILGVLVWFFMPPSVLGQSAAEWQARMERLRAYPDLIVTNGKITTMDTRLTEVQALAVRDHRIVALGTNDEIRALAGPKSEIVDAKGRRVLPGLVDSHTHPHLWAVGHWLGAEGDFTSKKYNDPQLKILLARGKDGTELMRSLEQVVRQRAQELGPGKWIWVYLFGGNTDMGASRKIVNPLFPQEGGGGASINPQLLDTLAPNNPVIVMSNEAIGPGEHNRMAGEIQQKLLDGIEVDGLQARVPMVYDILLRDRLEEKVDFIKRELEECIVPQGITTWGDTYKNSPSIMKVFNTLNQRGQLPARWGWWMGHYQGTGWNSNRDDLRLFYQNLGDFRGIGDDFIWNAGVAHESWEGGLTCTMAKPLSSSDPKTLMPACSPAIQANYEKQGGFRNVISALRAGMRIGFLHHYSDGTFDALFSLIEREIDRGTVTLEQVRALRISTEHTPIIRPDQIVKIAKYNIMPAFNGYQIQGDIKGGAFLKAYGEQYMNWMDPMKSVADAGGHPVFNTDSHLHKVPVEYKDMDYPPQWDGNIWGFMEFFVTRKMPHDGITYNRAEAMDRTTLMKAATIWSAEQLLNEKNIGSLEVGKLADFIVLDKDYFTIP
ncbi:MAG: amidohydrolase family protein, partial [Acidobacteria bacterium]|nr:amidohydrolase family protein [Acidobacteriota bacterium]